MGNGNQIISWIHISDYCNMVLYAIQNNKLSGIYNAVAPNPVSNKELMIKLAIAKHKAWAIKINIPAFLLKIMLGEMSVEILKSTTVSSKKIQNAGFNFKYNTIETAF